MNITKTNIDELNAVIKLQITKDDYEDSVNKVLKDYRRKVSIDGFRPGKVPPGLVKKRYGNAILVEEVNKIITREISKFIVDNNLDVLGEPLPNETEQKTVDWEKDEDFEFIFDIALSPKYTLSLSKKDKIDFFKIKVDEKMLQNGIDMHARRFGSQQEVEVAEDKELLKGNFAEIDAEGNVMEDGVNKENATFSLQYMKDDEIKKSFAGAKKGQTIVIDIAKAFSNKTDLSLMLSISKEKAENLNTDFQFTITGITKFVSAEINQELFDKAYGKGVVNSEDEFKKKITQEIEAQLTDNSNYKFVIDARQKLIKKSKIELPEEFLKRWILATNKDITKEQVEKDFENYSEDIKWQLIKERLKKENTIEVSEEELFEFAKKHVLAQFQQYGIMDLSEEHLQKYADQTLQNEEEKKRISSLKSDEKIIQFLKETVKLEEKEVSIEEFNKMFE